MIWKYIYIKNCVFTCLHAMAAVSFMYNSFLYSVTMGTRSSAVGWGTELHAGRSWVKFPIVSLEFCSDMILPARVWPRIDSASNRNGYQEYFLGVKVHRTDNFPTFMWCHGIWKPQQSGPVQDCTGIALPLLLQCNYTDPINSNLVSLKTWHEIFVGSLRWMLGQSCFSYGKYRSVQHWHCPVYYAYCSDSDCSNQKSINRLSLLHMWHLKSHCTAACITVVK